MNAPFNRYTEYIGAVAKMRERKNKIENEFVLIFSLLAPSPWLLLFAFLLHRLLFILGFIYNMKNTICWMVEARSRDDG